MGEGERDRVLVVEGVPVRDSVEVWVGVTELVGVEVLELELLWVLVNDIVDDTD